MDKLIDCMKVVLANSFAFYLKAHNFHWNVEGPNFFEYHGLFDEIYNEVYGSIDSTAEEIRALSGYAPGSMKRYIELTSIEDEMNIPSALEMVNRLAADNQKVIAYLLETLKEADAAEEFGLSNYLQDRINAHKKHAWKMRATLVRN
jgi:starvation-inducible DNA-binding protein